MNVDADTELSSEELAAMGMDMLGLWAAGGTLAEAKGMTLEECEAVYTLGHARYSQGKHDDAFKIFAYLVAYDHLDSRYQMALAAAMQATHRYEEALQQYMIVTLMRIDDPVPIYHSAECLLALGRTDDAAESLEMVIGTMCKPGEHDAIKSHAQALLKALRQKTKGD
ncbi:MAG: SycD/LcrH family type III secretion system chaperone [Burkholderiaceae bacterium]|nr:SycD/LcrH family type III secretion system chaperone [Burkholderiaceae bacterium]